MNEELVELSCNRTDLLTEEGVLHQSRIIYGLGICITHHGQEGLRLHQLMRLHSIEHQDTTHNSDQEGCTHLLQQVADQLIQALLSVEAHYARDELLALLVHLLHYVHEVPEEGEVEFLCILIVSGS